MKKLKDILLDESYRLMEEMVDINNIYPYESGGKYIFHFIDRYNNKHGIRALFQPIRKFGHEEGYYEIKFGVIIDDKKWIYDEPTEHDEKVFNTHVHISLKEIIEKLDEVNEWRLPPVQNDIRRYRLFRIALNKYIDKSKWNIINNPKDSENVIWLKSK
jgi:hypothetical protein